MAKIVTLRNIDNTIIYPQTKMSAVIDDDGNPMSSFASIEGSVITIGGNSIDVAAAVEVATKEEALGYLNITIPDITMEEF